MKACRFYIWHPDAYCVKGNFGRGVFRRLCAQLFIDEVHPYEEDVRRLKNMFGIDMKLEA